jgi:hypothetical protein
MADWITTDHGREENGYVMVAKASVKEQLGSLQMQKD